MPIKMVINFYGFVLNILFTLLYIIPCMEGLLKINIKMRIISQSIWMLHYLVW